MLAELNELFINVQTVSHCILLILDTIKTCRIYHANEQLQSQIVCKNEVTRRGHVIRRSVSTFLGSTNCLLIILIIRCLSKLNVCMTLLSTFLHEYTTFIFSPISTMLFSDANDHYNEIAPIFLFPLPQERLPCSQTNPNKERRAGWNTILHLTSD